MFCKILLVYHIISLPT